MICNTVLTSSITKTSRNCVFIHLHLWIKKKIYIYKNVSLDGRMRAFIMKCRSFVEIKPSQFQQKFLLNQEISHKRTCTVSKQSHVHNVVCTHKWIS